MYAYEKESAHCGEIRYVEIKHDFPGAISQQILETGENNYGKS